MRQYVSCLPVMTNGRATARIKYPGKISGKKCKQGSGVGGICSGDFFKFKFHFCVHAGRRPALLSVGRLLSGTNDNECLFIADLFLIALF